MKYLIIDDNEQFSKALCKELNGEIVSLLSELGLTAKDVVERTKDNADAVIIINVNLTVKESRQNHEGITLLKWIRLNGCRNHCILYSFQSLHTLVKANPLNSILFSKGVSFIQLPFSVGEIAAIVSSEKAERENLLPYFRAEIDLVKIRHELANIWAIHRMKLILGIEDIKDSNNFFIQTLKYITQDYSKKERINNNTLLDQINSFQSNGKKIFYYDDMADEWAIPLKKLFGSSNIDCINAKNISPVELFKKIKLEKPGCILLDLRLKNEKGVLEVLEYSGGQVLQAIKKEFITLPVIMFTATNKAESVRRLLVAGADYVWTKEGIDDGINDLRTLDSVKSILTEVGKALSKFKNIHYEKIFKVECELLNSPDFNYINDVLTTGALKHIKSIYFDANYFINSIRDNYLHHFYSLLLANKQLKYRKRIIIHADILNEIITIGRQDENYVNPDSSKDRNNAYRVPVCRFLLELIIRWRQENLILVEFTGGQDDIINEISKIDLSLNSASNSLEELENAKQNLIRNLAEHEETNKQQVEDQVNQQFELIRSLIESHVAELQNLPDFKRIKLHADNTFTKIIPKSLDFGGVAFITDDNYCSYSVGQQFASLPYTNQQFRQLADKTIIKQATLPKGNYVNKYKHYSGNIFNRMLIPNTP